MKSTYVNENQIETLEDYSLLLATSIISIRSLSGYQVQAIKKGIMPEDMLERGATIIWYLQALTKLYSDQLESALELLPDDFNIQDVIKKVSENELVAIKKAIRKPRKKKCDG